MKYGSKRAHNPIIIIIIIKVATNVLHCQTVAVRFFSFCFTQMYSITWFAKFAKAITIARVKLAKRIQIIHNLWFLSLCLCRESFFFHQIFSSSELSECFLIENEQKFTFEEANRQMDSYKSHADYVEHELNSWCAYSVGCYRCQWELHEQWIRIEECVYLSKENRSKCHIISPDNNCVLLTKNKPI